MKVKIYSLLFLLAISHLGLTQEVSLNGTPKKSRMGFYGGYFGYKILYPGLQLGWENYLATTKNFQVVSDVNIFYYYQRDSQSALALNTRIGQRFTMGFGLFLETMVGVGVQQTFYVKKEYNYDGYVSSITKVKSTKTGFLPGVTLGVGYDFSKKTKLPIKCYFRTSRFWLYPGKNLTFQTSYTLESGIIYVPTWNKK